MPKVPDTYLAVDARPWGVIDLITMTKRENGSVMPANVLQVDLKDARRIARDLVYAIDTLEKALAPVQEAVAVAEEAAQKAQAPAAQEKPASEPTNILEQMAKRNGGRK